MDCSSLFCVCCLNEIIHGKHLSKCFYVVGAQSKFTTAIFFNGRRICVENYFNDAIPEGIIVLKYYAVELCMCFSLAFMILKNWH